MSPVSERFDRRSVSVALSYVLLLGVSTVLISGLFIAAGNLTQSQQERTVRLEMETIGEQLSNDVNAADRMARTLDDTDTIRIERQFPETVSGSTYRVTVTDSPGTVNTDEALVLKATNADVSLEVPLNPETDVDGDSSATGGTVVITYDESADELVIDDV